MTDEKNYRKLTATLTGPRLTDDAAEKRRKMRDPSEPPMPAWWDEDDATDGNVAAAQMLGAGIG